MKKNNKNIYRNYYVRQFKHIYDLIQFNHKKFIQLTNEMYITTESIKKYPNENKNILKFQEGWYRIQYNQMNQLIQYGWNMIDTIDKSCFPNVDFNYDHSFRNIYTLLDVIRKLIN